MKSIIFSIVGYGATFGVMFLMERGRNLEASYLFTLAVWAWGKSDYYRLKEKMGGR